jgi:histone deacetylase 1/2
VVHQVLRDNVIPFSESNKESVCDACQMAKSHQLPYPKSTSVSTSPLELVFSDVWGPASESFGRFKYYVSFIDDYSKFTWIYLFKKKSDVFQKFHDFQNHVERLFDKKILAMQTDWGGKYQKLNSFFQRVGISHLVSCPHAHQQNGPAERKHRHIVEVGLSLLAYASMPLKYWDEAFQTAVYLINHLPSKVIESPTPMEHLFGNSGDYSLLRIFGCACWPNLRPYNKHKLNFRSKQCAFLGYSNLHKGYRCLDISIGRIYISRDIVFDETVFPFASLHSNAGARLRHEIDLLPLSLQPLNLHNYEEHELHRLVDVNPASAADTAAESFLQDTDYTSGDDTSNFSVSGMEFGADTPRDRAQSIPTSADRFSSGSRSNPNL